MQLEEMTALDFTLFADPDYERLSEVARTFLPAIEALKGQIRVSALLRH
jgi:hypothetical protein